MPAFQRTHYAQAAAGPCSGIPIGDAYEGGIVAYVLQSGDPRYDASFCQGLIAATEDQSTSIRWDNGTNILPGTGSATLGTGLSHTHTIIAIQGGTAGSYAYAAGICADYSVTDGAVNYDDWYLLSGDEINQLYLNKNAIDGFDNYYYWSSTEQSQT